MKSHNLTLIDESKDIRSAIIVMGLSLIFMTICIASCRASMCMYYDMAKTYADERETFAFKAAKFMQADRGVWFEIIPESTNKKATSTFECRK